MNPKISVIMGIYNCADTLPQAIECILNQTEPDWELILCDDGSKDETYAVAQRYREKHPDKIILLKNEKNLGLNKTLNRCLGAARGKYIARMDGDDLCEADRFAIELAELEENPGIAVVSCAMTFFDEGGTWGRNFPKEFPENKDFLRGTPFCHAPCMVRKAACDAVGGYSESDKFLRVEDFDLWVKVYAAGMRGKNLARPLYHMRDDRSAFARRKFKYRINEARVICKAVKLLKLPVWGYLHALRPIAVGLLPAPVYQFLHKKRLGR